MLSSLLSKLKNTAASLKSIVTSKSAAMALGVLLGYELHGPIGMLLSLLKLL
jgi:hypothetical protein